MTHLSPPGAGLWIFLPTGSSNSNVSETRVQELAHQPLLNFKQFQIHKKVPGIFLLKATIYFTSFGHKYASNHVTTRNECTISKMPSQGSKCQIYQPLLRAFSRASSSKQCSFSSTCPHSPWSFSDCSASLSWGPLKFKWKFQFHLTPFLKKSWTHLSPKKRILQVVSALEDSQPTQPFQHHEQHSWPLIYKKNDKNYAPTCDCTNDPQLYVQILRFILHNHYTPCKLSHA